ncbi:MAG TPA: hypothetical protein VI456_14675 [Polyangia bacterium]
MTRPRNVRKWLGKFGVVGIVSAAMVMIPIFEHPAAAQQSWSPPAQQQWAPPSPGAPAYAPPPVDTARAVMEATQDAQADNNAVLWFFAGCLLGLIGVIIAAVVDPSPPPARMMGKSPEYLAVYMTTYKSVGHSAQLHSALWGIGVVLIVYVVLIVIIVEQANSMSTTIEYVMRP